MCVHIHTYVETIHPEYGGMNFLGQLVVMTATFAEVNFGNTCQWL